MQYIVINSGAAIWRFPKSLHSVVWIYNYYINTPQGVAWRWDLNGQVNTHMECSDSFISLFNTKTHLHADYKNMSIWFTGPRYPPAAMYIMYIVLTFITVEKIKTEGIKFSPLTLMNQLRLINRNGDKSEMKKQIAAKLMVNAQCFANILWTLHLPWAITGFLSVAREEWRKARWFHWKAGEGKKMRGW